jgi:tryptophanyl-tRNA synthetase
MGLLERAHSYKEKVARGISASVGLFTYPVLMAADILAPQADLVPVGQDQDQHVEMTRDMAQLFNNAFCAGDPGVPHCRPAKIGEGAARVPGTTFEKGTVLQVVTAIAPRRRDGGLRRGRGLRAPTSARWSQDVLAANAEECCAPPRNSSVLLAPQHARRFGFVDVQDRTLRVSPRTRASTCITRRVTVGSASSSTRRSIACCSSPRTASGRRRRCRRARAIRSRSSTRASR